MQIQKLTEFGSSGAGDGQLGTSLTGLATDADCIYVVDAANSRVQIFDRLDYSFIGKITGLSSPNGIDVDANFIYITTTTNGARIKIFNKTAPYAQVDAFGTTGVLPGQLGTSSWISLKVSATRIYVTDYTNFRLHVFEKNSPWNEIGALGVKGYGDGNFAGINAACEDDLIYTLDSGQGVGYVQAINANQLLYGGAITRIAQSFQASASLLNLPLTRGRAQLKKVGNPSGTVKATLYEHAGVFGISSEPGLLLAESDPIDISELSADVYRNIVFKFSTPALLTNTYYCIGFEYTGGDAANCVDVGTVTGGNAPGNSAYYDGSWHPSAVDCRFELVAGIPRIQTFDAVNYAFAESLSATEILYGQTRLGGLAVDTQYIYASSVRNQFLMVFSKQHPHALAGSYGDPDIYTGPGPIALLGDLIYMASGALSKIIILKINSSLGFSVLNRMRRLRRAA